MTDPDLRKSPDRDRFASVAALLFLLWMMGLATYIVVQVFS